MTGPAPLAAADTRAAPLDGDAFAALMAGLGPFEPAPHLAVALSGGADSLALTLLADAWARERRGRVTALTVDHGLRPDSGAEARTVAAWMAARGIAHQVLPWTGPKPAAGVQAAARTARLALLAGRCRELGILHLLLAHHLDDQAETVLMRLGRGSGPDGLAAMAPVLAAAETRLLRPLLTVPGARLRALLAAAGQGWIEDPSNADTRFERVRLRRRLAQRRATGASPWRPAAWRAPPPPWPPPAPTWRRR
ncbi:MAG: tRNA lysidine(34) synthetase TilS [Hyphomicrobiales bacterium]|nr:tRNA lysidine(34) synthetase TilS [Hyphomicrobiales bacterium]